MLPRKHLALLPRRAIALDTTPASLLVRLRRGADAPTWERFVALFTPLLDRWAHSLGLQDADAADLVQDVFSQLLQILPRFHYDPARSFRGWLRTVLINAWRDRRRAPGAAPLPDEVADEAARPDLAEAEYHRHLVGRAVQILQRDFAPATWQAFWETTVAGRPGAEVAAQLGLSVNAVYLARARVLNRLREELAGLYP
jgi:RNA polymerase sigma-70 factor (ECF subfamily)